MVFSPSDLGSRWSLGQVVRSPSVPESKWSLVQVMQDPGGFGAKGSGSLGVLGPRGCGLCDIVGNSGHFISIVDLQFKKYC